MMRLVLMLSLMFPLLAFAESGHDLPPVHGAPIVGQFMDAQSQPVAGVEVAVYMAGEKVAVDSSQEDGTFSVPTPEIIEGALELTLHRPHFKDKTLSIDQASELEALALGEAASLGTLTLKRRISIGFIIATLVFIAMLYFIATGFLHNTLSALAGVSALFISSYLLTLIHPDFYIFDFDQALVYLDWNVIFLILGMMMVIAIVEHTGIFQWLAFTAYRASGGRLWLLLIILMLIGSVGSAVLDNVTTMLLMAPITIRIALTLNTKPLALLMPVVMASNVAGVSTLVGTPTNILIGSYAGIGFNGFLKNQTPGALMALAGLIIYSLFLYRKQLFGETKSSEALVNKLRESARITQPENLQKSGWVGLGMLILFVFGESIHLVPAVTAIIGASVLLVWIRPNVEEMIRAVDWTTLVFFITLFIVVGAVQEVGLISFIATGIANVIGDNLILAMILITWLSALLSVFIANIPFTAAMLPVVGYLTATIPEASSGVLFYCLSVGAAMGGNGSLIGASANMVTAGISERAGYPISYGYFIKRGLPAIFVTVGLATVWLFIRF